MVRTSLASFGAALVAAMAAAIVAPSCSTFSGLTATEDGGSSTGTGGDAPPGFLTLEDGARACALAFECPPLPASIMISSGIPVDPVNFSMCMTWLAGPVPPGRVGLQLQAAMLECVAGATSCTGAGRCLSLERFEPGDPRCAGAGTGGAGSGGGGGAGGGGNPVDFCSPDNNSVIHCDALYAVHCDVAYFAPGTSCLQGADDSLWCTTGQNCTIFPSCSGQILDYCGGTTELRFGINCNAIGNTCGVDPDSGNYDCLTDGKLRLCDTLTAVCVGDTVESCDQDTMSLFKCAELGGTCNSDMGGARCVRPDDECTPFDAGINVCDGDSIALCVGGERVSFDCASIGRACVTVNGSVRCG